MTGALRAAVLRFESMIQIIPHKSRTQKKTSHRILHHIEYFDHRNGVLNEVYLQKFLHGWAVNRETNLISLLNSLFNSDATVTIR